MKNGLKRKMAIMLTVSAKAIRYDKSVDALVCTCGCEMELSAYCLVGIRQHEGRLFRNLHSALKTRAK